MSDYIFAGTIGYSVWRRPLSQVGITVVSSEVPEGFALQQNYPNPFNPSTKISFDLPVQSKVNVTVFDLTGKEIVTLVNEVKTAGFYSFDFNASNLSSGIYFYRISAGSFIATKKMTLIK